MAISYPGAMLNIMVKVLINIRYFFSPLSTPNTMDIDSSILSWWGWIWKKNNGSHSSHNLALHLVSDYCPVFGSCLLKASVVECRLIAQLRRPEGSPSGAPYSSCRGKIKETHELIFSWLSWLAVLLVGAYARRRRRSCPTWRPYSKKET